MSDQRGSGGRRHRDARRGADLQDMAEQAMEMWGEMGRMWLGAMTGFSGGSGRDRRREDVHERAVSEDRLAVSVEVSSALPAEVTLDLRPEGGKGRLSVRALEALDGNGPPLTGIEIDEVRGRPRVRVAVPKDQPAGVYVGPIIDEDQRAARGTIRIELGRERSAR